MHETVQMQQRGKKKALNLFSFFFLGGVFGSNCSLILTVPSRPTFLTKKTLITADLKLLE